MTDMSRHEQRVEPAPQTELTFSMDGRTVTAKKGELLIAAGALSLLAIGVL